ncbi:hypothetical protein GM658_23570 [Pseudoduganella eburnea]|uniref:Histidine kinase/HSP90-like ATPase domain-containing protein n=1 Tax=Massilia eburnea TaxID=1776165 RepID=A0A6L6QN47_9BURK|nr:histidine kinase [Massilia eburnea]MTW13595.1 hypothetical protein [Massilia eburnea]
MKRLFIARGAWRYVLTVLALCLLLSTEVLFSPGTWYEWSPGQILAGWLEQLGDTTVLGLLAMLAVAGTDHLFQRDGHWRLAAVLAAATAATTAGFTALTLFRYPAGYYPPLLELTGEALRAILLADLFTLVWGRRRQAARAALRTRRLALDRAVLQRRTEEARLKVLEAQIEPHFLFNTLATVKCLYQAGAAEADRMLSSLRLYLGAALPQIRDDGATLASECELARAYLEILHIRMGNRLQFVIDLPDELASHAFPPMMLVTLVENAIKHGLAPAAEGGRVDISAKVQEGRLQVSVADNGVGFQSSCGSGVGLVNIRARLRTLFGQGAALALQRNMPRGVVASIEIPLHHGAPRWPLHAADDPAADAGPDAHCAPRRQAGEVNAAALPASSWRQCMRARLPLLLLVGLVTGAIDELRVLPIDLDVGGWQYCLGGAAVVFVNGLLFASVMVGAITAAERIAAAPRWRPPLLAAAVAAGALLAAALAVPPSYFQHRFIAYDYVGLFVHMLWLALTGGALLAAGLSVDARSRQAAARLWSARRDCADAKRLMVESRLNILKARIEPALLVREIGRIQALYRGQHNAAEQQLDRLIAYLQAALPHLHGGGATLGDEVQLAHAYLRLHAGSWGERLDWDIDVAPAMHGLRFPPMTLLPLIDDALRRAQRATQPRLFLQVRLQAAASGFRLLVEDNCAATTDQSLQYAMTPQAQSFRDFYGQRGTISREVEGNATRVALAANFDADGCQMGLS